MDTDSLECPKCNGIIDDDDAMLYKGEWYHEDCVIEIYNEERDFEELKRYDRPDI